MFLKLTRSKNNEYLQLVKSYRQGNTVRHKVIAHLGRLDELRQTDTLRNVAEKLLQLNGTPCLRSEDMQETARLCYGHLIYEKIWQDLGIPQVLQKCLCDRRIRFDLPSVVFYGVIHRLLRSQSKLQAFLQQGNFFRLPSIRLEELYRSLDFLSDRRQAILTQLAYCAHHRYPRKIDVAFYDVTTYHFESNRSDELRQFGFSKAGKFNEVQVVMGLWIDPQGRPLGYDLFSGNTFEGNTLLTALKTLQDHYRIRKVTIVADKGLNSRHNLHLLRQAGCHYIVSARLKNLPHTLAKQVLDPNSLQTKQIDETSGEVLFASKRLDYPMRFKNTQGQTHEWQDQLLITWSAGRAAKDAAERQRQIEKAQQKVTQKAHLLQRKGPYRFVKPSSTPAPQALRLDEQRIAEDQRWDGYYGIQFSEHALSDEDVLKHYHYLWKIEESFRVLKTTLRTRPVFHWTPKRIEGHFMLCFLAFMLERELEIRLKKANIYLSPCQLKQELNGIQLSEFQIQQDKYFLDGCQTPIGEQLLALFQIPRFKRLTPAN